jgi:hypothetical protein
MRTKRIELEGRAGHVAIERQRGSATIRIDSIIADPGKGEQAWKTWEIDTKGTDDTELFWIATEVQRRCDGVVGTNSDVEGYFRELQRFAD